MVGPDVDDPEMFDQPMRVQLLAFLEEHRSALDAALDDLSEEQARRQLVTSSTTLLGLVKHATFAERVWFEEAFTGLPRSTLGIEADPEESFALADDDTIASVLADYRATCARSRQAIANLTLDDVVTGNRRGALPLRWILLHMLRELAQHCGHVDILREQVTAS